LSAAAVQVVQGAEMQPQAVVAAVVAVHHHKAFGLNSLTMKLQEVFQLQLERVAQAVRRLLLILRLEMRAQQAGRQSLVVSSEHTQQMVEAVAIHHQDRVALP
jgi:hypothetical protein